MPAPLLSQLPDERPQDQENQDAKHPDGAATPPALNGAGQTALEMPGLEVEEDEEITDPVTQELYRQPTVCGTKRLRAVTNRVGQVIMARTGSRRCTASCQHARGPTCVCSCGGVNHGVSQ